MFKKFLLAAIAAAAVVTMTTPFATRPASAYVGFTLGGPYQGFGPSYEYYYGPGYFGPYRYPPPYYDGYYPRYHEHGDAVASCAARFRSYDPVTHSYLGYDGQRHHCR